MAPLGWWVSEKAERATEVALNEIDGIRCPELLSVTYFLIGRERSRDLSLDSD